MKRFVWRLQRVLDIKRKEEQTKKAELLKITDKLAQTRSGLLIQKRILENIIDSLTGERPKRRLRKQEFFLKCSAINDELIEKLESKVSELESAQREKIAEILRVKRSRESLEKLRAEAKAQFIKLAEKLDEKELDEGATIGFARKMMQQGRIRNLIG